MFVTARASALDTLQGLLHYPLSIPGDSPLLKPEPSTHGHYVALE